MEILLQNNLLKGKIKSHVEELVQLVEHLPSMHKTLGSVPSAIDTCRGRCNTLEVAQKNQKLKVTLSYTASPRLAQDT